MNERDIEQLAQRLGERQAAAIDPEAMASMVVAELRNERRSSHWRAPALGIAAAFALMVVGALLLPRGELPPGDSGAVVELEPRRGAGQVGLDDLGETELMAVMDEMDLWMPTGAPVEPDLDDLDAEQLETLLSTITDQGV